MTTKADALASRTLASLRDGCSAYLDILDAGTPDPRADELMRSLYGVSLSTLTDGEVEQIATTCASLVAVRDERPAPSTTGPTLLARQDVTADSDAYAPSASSAGTAAPWVSWLAYARAEGDQVVVRAPGSSTPLAVGEPGGVVNRQVVAGDATTGWLVTSRRDGDHWSLSAVHLVGGKAGQAELVTDSSAVNPELCVTDDGTVHVVYQGVVEGRYVVMHVERTAAGWGVPTPVSPSDETAWDPSIAVADGVVTAMWSVHRDGRFRLAVRQRIGGRWEEERVAPLGVDGHALHGSVSPGSGGSWWVVCDIVAAETLATSGRTAAVATEKLRQHGPHHPVPAYDLTTQVEVLRLDEQGWSRPTGDAVAERSSGSYPRVAEDGAGRLWLGYRTLRQLPFRHYVSHVAVRVHDGTGWTDPTLAPESDGTNAEFALVADADGVTAVYHGDRHQERFRAMLASPAAASDYLRDESPESVRREHLMLPALDRMSTGGHLGHGQVRTASFTSDVRRGPAVAGASDHQRIAPTDRPRPAGWPPPAPAGGNELHLWWGDLHRHSNISRCGAGLDVGVDDHYRLIEDVMGCDFWALTDHAENTSDLNWHHLRKLANAFYRPGTHVPLVGFEWTSFSAGHMNVIYAGDDGPLLSSSDPETATPDGLWRALEAHEALTIPHHPAALVYATDWSYRSERFLRVVEVFQAATGSYESTWCPRQYQDAVAPGASVHEALAVGHRLGFIASTDHRSGAAFVGLYAPALDRASVYAALADRRCFGATRRGIVPHLRVGDAWPGQTVMLADALATGGLRFAGSGIAPLATVQLVRDGEVVADARSTTRADGIVTVPLDVRMLSRQGGRRDWAGSITVRDGGRVVPATHWAPEVTRVGDDSVHWEVELPARYGGRVLAPGVVTLGATLTGRPDAVVEIAAGDRSLRTTLAELSELTAGRRLADGTELDELAVRSGVGGFGSLGTTTWEADAPADLLRAGSWYTTRVIQSDGEMAWSSPVWVD